MKGIQVFSSKTYSINTSNFEIRSFDLMSLLLGALYWKKYNGKVELYTDSVAYDFLETNNLCKYWDKIDYQVLDDIDPNINQKVFTKYCNIHVLDKIKVPFCIFNNYVQIQKKLKIKSNVDIKYYIREKFDYPFYIDPTGYLNKSTLKKLKIDSFYNIFNAEVLIFNNEHFIKQYKKEVNTFLKVPNILKSDDYDYNSIKDLFFQQQLLAYTAYKYNYSIDSILDGIYVRDSHRSAHFENCTTNINKIIENNTLNLDINSQNINVLNKVEDFLLVIKKYIHIFKYYFPIEFEETKNVIASCNSWCK